MDKKYAVGQRIRIGEIGIGKLMNLSLAPFIRALIAVLTVIFLLAPATASELIVPAGCAAPMDSAGGRIFYIDPVAGSMANDGSASRPWRTFAEVVAQSSRLISSRVYKDFAKGQQELQPINPDGPVKPGDTLVLMSGDHGDVEIRLYENDRFIHVVAGKDQTPVIRSMRIVSSSQWIFKGLKFESERPEKNLYGGMVDVGGAGYYGPTKDIVFDSDSFATRDNVEEWSDADWVGKPYTYAMKADGFCTTLFGNHFYNIRNAVAIAGDNSLAQDNLIEHFGNDGIEIMASNLTLRHNLIKSGHHTKNEILHADGIQGWSLKDAVNRNILIEANTIINLEQSDDSYMQGISIFDGSWDGMKIINNVVVTNIWHGIALYGVNNAEVINNTVVPSRPARYKTWITVHWGKGSNPSTNVVVRNNIAGEITVGGVNITVDHNISGSDVSIQKPKGDAFTNSVEASVNMTNVPMSVLFRELDIAGQILDLRPSPNSPSREAGSDQGAPATDIEGRKRKSPIDIGAYAR